MDTTAFTLRRWLDRFKLDNVRFDGRPLRSKGGSGYGSDDPSSPGWVGWYSGGA